jgi:hypothetical protein
MLIPSPLTTFLSRGVGVWQQGSVRLLLKHRDYTHRGVNERKRLIAAPIRIQLVILTLKFRSEVFFANPRFADLGVLAWVCVGGSLRGTG